MSLLPAEHDPLPAPKPDPHLAEVLRTRRSTKVIHLAGPGPDDGEIDTILAAAMRVPDHGKIGPWRVIVIAGARRAALGKAMAARLAETQPDSPAATLAGEEARWTRAPVVLCVVSSPVVPHKIPVWEQELSVGALCLNILLGCHAAGYGACWLTGWNSQDAGAAALLGVGAGERIAGFISVGTATEAPTERVRPDPASRISRY